MILTTSNVTEKIDLAFVDRADIKQYIGPPSENGIYNIYLSCLEELMKVTEQSGNVFSAIPNYSSFILENIPAFTSLLLPCSYFWTSFVGVMIQLVITLTHARVMMATRHKAQHIEGWWFDTRLLYVKNVLEQDNRPQLHSLTSTEK